MLCRMADEFARFLFTFRRHGAGIYYINIAVRVIFGYFKAVFFKLCRHSRRFILIYAATERIYICAGLPFCIIQVFCPPQWENCITLLFYSKKVLFSTVCAKFGIDFSLLRKICKKEMSA